MCSLADYEDLELLPAYRVLLEHELDNWHTDYLPLPKRAVVLDVGAGCGETVRFYLLHGAKRVVAIEGNPDAYRCLRINFGSNRRVTTVRAQLDKIKIDIERGEEGLDLEVHFAHRWRVMGTRPNGYSGERGRIKQMRLERR